MISQILMIFTLISILGLGNLDFSGSILVETQ